MSQNPLTANKLLAAIDDTASDPSISWGGSAPYHSGTGIYGDASNIYFCIGGVQKLGIDSSGSIVGPAASYSSASSHQVLGPDLTLSAGAGRDAADGSSFLASIMGNIISDSMTKTANYLAGVIGAYSITGSNGSLYPKGGVLGIVSDGVSVADGAVVAVLDGDSTQTIGNAAFKAMSNNSIAGSGFTYGLDLQGAAHSGYPALAILKADIRTASGAVIMTGAGAPTNNVTGLNFAGRGSLYIDTTNGKLYITTAVSSAPTWVVVGSQS